MILRLLVLQNVQLARARLLVSPSYSLPSGKSCWTWTSGKRSVPFTSASFMMITVNSSCNANYFFRRLFRSSSLSAVAVVATLAWPLTTGGGVEICLQQIIFEVAAINGINGQLLFPNIMMIRFNHNCMRDAVLIAICNCVTRFCDAVHRNHYHHYYKQPPRDLT